MSEKNYQALIKPQFLFLNDKNQPKIWPVGHSMHTSLSTTHIYLPTLPLVGGPCKMLWVWNQLTQLTQETAPEFYI